MLTAFLKADINDQDVAKAKAFYKTSLLNVAEGTGIVDLLAKQVAADNVISPLLAASAVDAVTTADVKQVSAGIDFMEFRYINVDYSDSAAKWLTSGGSFWYHLQSLISYQK